mmetsp:Transcript_9912/g.32775  ORF Transcript_9912/g.32775 Transcript_9912/m.32775 type:complete len:224 (-) Transcript_9912:1526-2197(-)
MGPTTVTLTAPPPRRAPPPGFLGSCSPTIPSGGLRTKRKPTRNDERTTWTPRGVYAMKPRTPSGTASRTSRCSPSSRRNTCCWRRSWTRRFWRSSPPPGAAEVRSGPRRPTAPRQSLRDGGRLTRCQNLTPTTSRLVRSCSPRAGIGSECVSTRIYARRTSRAVRFARRRLPPPRCPPPRARWMSSRTTRSGFSAKNTPSSWRACRSRTKTAKRCSCATRGGA